MKSKCELGKTEFVDEKDVGKGVINGSWKISDEKLKIKNNTYQCEGKIMKGDIYGIK